VYKTNEMARTRSKLGATPRESKVQLSVMKPRPFPFITPTSIIILPFILREEHRLRIYETDAKKSAPKRHEIKKQDQKKITH
jgi:hypothetical protein